MNKYETDMPEQFVTAWELSQKFKAAALGMMAVKAGMRIGATYTESGRKFDIQQHRNSLHVTYVGLRNDKGYTENTIHFLPSEVILNDHTPRNVIFSRHTLTAKGQRAETAHETFQQIDLSGAWMEPFVPILTSYMPPGEETVENQINS